MIVVMRYGISSDISDNDRQAIPGIYYEVVTAWYCDI